MNFVKEKDELIYWAKLMNQKSLVTARSGNISSSLGDGSILMTCRDSYLGQLEHDEIVIVDSTGELISGEREPTSEKDLHLSVYNAFEDIGVVIHAHSPNTVGFFMQYEALFCTSFEAEMYLGEVPVVEQNSPTVTDIEPVIDALRRNKIVVLGRHGVLAIGKDFKEAYSLVEVLEEQSKINIALGSDVQFSEQYKQDIAQFVMPLHDLCTIKHADALVKLMDKDVELEETAAKQDIVMNLSIADDTGKALTFYFEKGQLVKIDESVSDCCVIRCSSEVLQMIFNGEINPYVALVQGRAILDGDFGLMSLYYETLQCVFEFFKCCDFA